MEFNVKLSGGTFGKCSLSFALGVLVGLFFTCAAFAVLPVRSRSAARCVCNDSPGVWCDACGHWSSDCPRSRFYRPGYRLDLSQLPCLSNRLTRSWK